MGVTIYHSQYKNTTCIVDSDKVNRVKITQNENDCGKLYVFRVLVSVLH